MSPHKQWWWHEENSNHHQLLDGEREQHPHTNLTILKLLSRTAETLATTTVTTATTTTTTTHPSSSYLSSLLTSSNSVADSIQKLTNYENIDSNNLTESTIYETNDWMLSGTLIVFIIIYGIIVFGGILGNVSLVLTLCSASSVRLRNPLLLALCFADLLVTGISAPSTLVTLTLTQKTQSWSLALIGCKTIYYLQSMPVAASTISFLMLSLDRYATVKHPRLAQLRQRRYLHTIVAILCWVAAGAICLPILLGYKIKTFIPEGNVNIINDDDTTTDIDINLNLNNDVNDGNSLLYHSQKPQEAYSTCRADYGSIEFRSTFIIIHTVLVFILPFFGVLLNHYGVRQKLCALSLTARAAHGELPLPMPILRRPTHMIIVTGIANANRGVVDELSSSDDDDDHDNPMPQIDQQFMQETAIKTTTSPMSPRAMREFRAQQQRQKLEDRMQQSVQLAATPGIPLPQTSTLRSRRRLANMLIASAFIFIGCWSPHVFCILWNQFGNEPFCSKVISHLSLLLGYAHSAISPIIYWALNHNTLRQSPCAPFMRFSAVQKYFQTIFRSPAAPPPPSSTNEAALGPFNPKYIRTTPKQYRAQASSHYLY